MSKLRFRISWTHRGRQIFGAKTQTTVSSAFYSMKMNKFRKWKQLSNLYLYNFPHLCGKSYKYKYMWRALPRRQKNEEGSTLTEKWGKVWTGRSRHSSSRPGSWFKWTRWDMKLLYCRPFDPSQCLEILMNFLAVWCLEKSEVGPTRSPESV